MLCVRIIFQKILIQFQKKNPYPPHGRSLEISRAEEVLRSQNLRSKQNYEAKLQLGDGGCKAKILLWGRYGYFLELHIGNSRELGGGGAGGSSQKAKIF